jgi:hypothetical protein
MQTITKEIYTVPDVGGFTIMMRAITAAKKHVEKTRQSTIIMLNGRPKFSISQRGVLSNIC